MSVQGDNVRMVVKAELLFRCDYFPPWGIPGSIIISAEILCAGYGMNLGNLYHYEIL